MKSICAFLTSLVLAAACCASELSDSINMEVVKSTIPTNDVSAVVSPYSVVMVSGLLGDGMDGRELRIALSEKFGLRTTSFGPTFMRLRSQLAGWALSNRVEVLFANSFWMRNYSRIDREFHAMASRTYGVAFGPLAGVDAINAWSSAKTGGLVSKVMERVNPSCDTAIVSASGFNGAWARPFPTAKKGVFHASGGDVEMPMMEDMRRVKMVKRPGYTAFSLMYRGDKLGLFVLLPEEGKTPNDVGCMLTAAEFDILDRALLPDYHPQDANGDVMPEVDGASTVVARVKMPKFRVETTVDMIPAFAALGVQRTGYDSICKNLRIGTALQQNVFETSETGGEVGLVELPEVKADGDPAVLACDRPFVFFVRTVEHLTLLVGRFNGH